jgi:hypothetical protein
VAQIAPLKIVSPRAYPSTWPIQADSHSGSCPDVMVQQAPRRTATANEPYRHRRLPARIVLDTGLQAR